MNPSDALETPRGVLERRRNAAREGLGCGVLVLPAPPAQIRSRDEEWPHHPDRELFYLTGVAEPGAVAVLVGGEEPRFVLFVQERDPEAELWNGVRLGTEGAAERFGPDACHPLAELDRELPALLRGADRIYYRLGRGDALERHVVDALAYAKLRGARTGVGPRAVVDPGEILDELRVVKDEHELGLLRRAAEITVEGHLAAMAHAAPGRGEWVVEAAVDAAFRSAGGGGNGFDTIVGSGVNACVLHYRDNASVIEDGSLVLVDAGADYGLYNGDVTRTFPANGRFSPEQRDVYQIVDAARRAAIERVAPGVDVTEVHAAAARTIAEGLVSLGVLEGDVDGLVEGEQHKPFFPHQTSHWLGLDVHDAGDYAGDGRPRKLAPGMVLTVEPGLYFGPGRPGVPERLAGIGVRVEDDVVVTVDGAEVLTGGAPTDASEVEALVRASR